MRVEIKQLLLVLILIVLLAGCTSPSPEEPIETDDTPQIEVTTVDNSEDDEDNDTKSHQQETEVQIIDGSPEAGLHNQTLEQETLEAIEFLADMPSNETVRDELIIETATEICDAHDQEIAEVPAEAADISDETYRNTYRVEHTASVLHDQLNADIRSDKISSRMNTARYVSGTAGQYAPVYDSYTRLHEASCAVKSGEEDSKEEFYVASAAFTVDLVLVQHGTAYKASFDATRYVSQQVGLMRLSRVCGYKCVGLVQSEIHWHIRGTIHDSVDLGAEYIVEKDLAETEWDESTEEEVREYIEDVTEGTIVDGYLIHREQLVDCAESRVTLEDVPSYALELGRDVGDALETILTDGELPDNIDISQLTEVDEIRECVTEE